jgi:hypothetical protein
MECICFASRCVRVLTSSSIAVSIQAAFHYIIFSSFLLLRSLGWNIPLDTFPRKYSIRCTVFGRKDWKRCKVFPELNAFISRYLMAAEQVVWHLNQFSFECVCIEALSAMPTGSEPPWRLLPPFAGRDCNW